LSSLADGRPTTLFTALSGNQHSLLLLPVSHDREAASHLLNIAADTARAFPNVLCPHLILKANTAGSGSVASGVPAWLDTEGRLHQKLHATRATLILVRPDGYIGYRCQPADGETLVEYLGRYLLRNS
jgi:hypothetical protein